MTTFYKVEVSTGNPNRWDTNRLLFRTREQAELYAADLASRWTLVADWRVREATADESDRDRGSLDMVDQRFPVAT